MADVEIDGQQVTAITLYTGEARNEADMLAKEIADLIALSVADTFYASPPKPSRTKRKRPSANGLRGWKAHPLAISKGPKAQFSEQDVQHALATRAAAQVFKLEDQS